MLIHINPIRKGHAPILHLQLLHLEVGDIERSRERGGCARRVDEPVGRRRVQLARNLNLLGKSFPYPHFRDILFAVRGGE